MLMLSAQNPSQTISLLYQIAGTDAIVPCSQRESSLPLPAFLFILITGMKLLNRVGFLALAATLFAGCFSKPKVLYRVTDARPPDFLAGPVALLLTNVPGFSAKLAGSISSESGSQSTMAGDLLGRDGSLVFQPQSSVKGKRARSEGGMFFIWNETAQAGFVLSDPLQAYAPTSMTVQPTNVVLDATRAIDEEANGHPCRRIDALVQSSDGSTMRFKVWQAEDAKLFPVRIRTVPGPQEMVINFTDVRLELPASALFSPPDGFVKYDSPLALVNELIIRQSALNKGNEGPGIQLNPAGGPSMSNWRPGPAQ
jgi:hypothetical protein